MVGHTGIVEATKKACTTIDACCKAIADRALELDGQLLITADHGNCELMIKPDGSPHTAHTTNLVYGYYLARNIEGVTVKDGKLADVSPTLLDMLGVEKPVEMTGQSLLVRA